MRNFQDTFETRKQSFISAFSNCHDCTSKLRRDTKLKLKFIHYDNIIEILIFSVLTFF